MFFPPLIEYLFYLFISNFYFNLVEFSGNKRERNKRSDTAKRHILARQKQIDSSEVHNNGVSKTNFSDNRR